MAANARNTLAERCKRLEDAIARAAANAGRTAHGIRVVVVTKTHPAPVLQALIDAGRSDIGENKVQEIVEKVPRLHGDKTIHLVGRLQTNKIARAVPLVDWIQSIDSERLAEKLNRECERIGKTMNVLVQVNTSGEQTKSGCAPSAALELCEKAASFPFLRLRGLMTIGRWEGGEKETRACFSALRSIGEQAALLCDGAVELSMGMSGDFALAIEEGATILRIGTYLLGERAC